MPDIEGIIRAIDSELEITGKPFLTPPEANAVLQRRGLLRDSIDRRGLPLRNILRSGQIRHAYQVAGKGSGWRIPHSESTTQARLRSSLRSDPRTASGTPGDRPRNADFQEVAREIERAREKYKPEIIKILLIAEAPPDHLERFFYFPDVRKADWLFLGVMQALYPDKKEQYLVNGRPASSKERLLWAFANDGFYLVDLLDVPLSFYAGSLAEAVPALITKVRPIIGEATKIILVKPSVYDVAFEKLRQQFGSKVIDKRIDFPASGGQAKFQAKFRAALSLAQNRGAL